MALEDKLDNDNNNYESKLERKLNKKSSIFKIALDTLLYTPVVAASAYLFGPAVTLSTAIPAIGYSIGAWIENKRKKIKTTWNRVKRELYTGNIMGHVDYGLFSTPEYLFKAFPSVFNTATFSGMLTTSLVFNPLLFIPVNILYGAFFHLRDKIGFGNLFKGVFNGKIANYTKSTYRNVKENLGKDTWNVFKYLFPLHFFQTHYLPSLAQKVPYLKDMPVAALRMTQSALVNNPMYRLIMGRQGKRGYASVPTYAKAPATAYDYSKGNK